jgi:hypothetical protein
MRHPVLSALSDADPAKATATPQNDLSGTHAVVKIAHFEKLKL